MVVAEQMERGMDGKEAKLSFDAVAVFLCLRLCFFGGNDDVAERNGVAFKGGAVGKLFFFSLLSI